MKLDIASMIDHTLLSADASEENIKTLCREAMGWHFASVCVNPLFISLVADELRGSEVKVCSVIGFPLGAHTQEIKKQETRLACSQGAQEIDMVIAVGKAKAGEWNYVEEDIRTVVQAASPGTVKVILETCFLTLEEIIAACKAAERAGAHYVKTSTGFGSGGATLENVALMKKTVPLLKVKASGGIRSRETALAMIQAGASRLGTSSGISIMQE